jgi:phage tail sheath protein FI
MAGVYAKVDGTSGVWKSPANVGLNFVDAPAVKISNKEQDH